MLQIEEFYKKVGGSYEEVFGRLRDRERILKFVLKFPADRSFSVLKTALEKGDMKEALRAASTLQCVCLNLGFTELTDVSRELSEYLRIGGTSDTLKLFRKVEDCYACTIDLINNI